MSKPDWKQAMLNEAAANAEADAAWAAEAEAYAKSMWWSKALALTAFVLLTKLAVPALSAVGMLLASPVFCTADYPASVPCTPALAGVVLLVGLYAALLSWQMWRRGFDWRWNLLFFFLAGDSFTPIAADMGWASISLPEFALYMAAFGLPFGLSFGYHDRNNPNLL